MKLLKPIHEFSEQIIEYREAFYTDEQPHGSSSLQNFDSLDEWFEKVSIYKNWEKTYKVIEYRLANFKF